MQPTSDWLCYTAGNPNRRADTPTGTGDIDDTLQNEFRSVDSVMAECGFVGVMWAKVRSPQL